MVGALALFVALSSSQDDVIKIGIVASQNGPLVPWGSDAINGAQLAVDQVNKAGGIDGKQVQLLVEDCYSTPEGGKSATQKLVREGVVGLLGSVSSGITQPMAQVSTEHGIPHVVIGGTKSGLVAAENVFRVCYTDNYQAHAMAKFAHAELGLRKIAVVTDEKQPYSYYLSKEFSEHFKKLGGEIAGEVSYESAQTDFSSQVVDLIKMRPDGVFLGGFFNEVGPLVRQAVQIGLDNVKFLGGDGWESMELIAGGGDAIIGGYFSTTFNNDLDLPETRKFISAWKAKHDSEPGTTMAALGYDAAKLLMDAIDRADSTESEAVIAALADTVGFRGLSGPITLKGHGGDAARSIVVNMVLKSGFTSAAIISWDEVYGG